MVVVITGWVLGSFPIALLVGKLLAARSAASVPVPIQGPRPAFDTAVPEPV